MRRNLLFVAILAVAAPARAAEPGIAMSAAWAHAAAKGADTTLYLTAENPAAEDAIVRVRCDAANFVELRTVDRGEGFPSARAVKAIPIAAGGKTVLTKDGFNIRLLQLTRTLEPGEHFDCTLRLRGGGQQVVSAEVKPADTGADD